LGKIGENIKCTCKKTVQPSSDICVFSVLMFSFVTVAAGICTTLVFGCKKVKTENNKTTTKTIDSHV